MFLSLYNQNLASKPSFLKDINLIENHLIDLSNVLNIIFNLSIAICNKTTNSYRFDEFGDVFRLFSITQLFH